MNRVVTDEYLLAEVPKERCNKIFRVYTRPKQIGEPELRDTNFKWHLTGHAFVSKKNILLAVSSSNLTINNQPYLDLQYPDEAQAFKKAFKNIILNRKLLPKYVLDQAFPKKKFYLNVSVNFWSRKFQICISDEIVDPAQFLTHSDARIRKFCVGLC